MEKTVNVLVIGGGPAGMMAAGRAAEMGAEVLLLEQNARLGRKLSITGGGRCNITNAEFDTHLFLDNFKSAKGHLFSTFAQFDVQDTFTFFESRGLPLKIEDRKRAFPKSDNALDVVKTLEAYVRKTKRVTVLTGVCVERIETHDGIVKGVRTNKGYYSCEKLILATGGVAAPDTGSSSIGVDMLKPLGHSVKDPDPNLSPLKSPAGWVHKLSGTTIDDAKLRFVQNKQSVHKVRGRILFTHFGISGPTVINAAHTVKEFLKKGSIDAHIDLHPDHDIGSLDTELLHDLEQEAKKQIKSILRTRLQKRLADTVLKRAKLNPDITGAEVTREQRRALVNTLKDLSFPISGTMGYEWSIVADGGVDPKEIDFRSMQSRHFENLYIIGDAININRPSGGYSLQLCWSMGHVAGNHAAQTENAP